MKPNEDYNPEIVEPDIPWFGFDTENDKNGKVTETALVCESGDSWVFNRAGKLLEWMEHRQERKQPAVVICHNLEYDLVNELGRDAYAELNLNYLKGRLISARYGPIRFLDSFNHFRMSLADIGEAIGITKKTMDIHDPEYVKTDAWICLKVMTGARDYIASLGGKIGATSGSSSLSVWGYMTDEEFYNGPHDTAWMRKGYYGGRTEIFRRLTQGKSIGSGWDIKDGEPFEREFREKSIRGYDINSMYPFCMLNEFPETYMDDYGINKAKGMAEVSMRIPEMRVSPLCHRLTDGSLVYPIGSVRGVWTYDEIRLAEQVGCSVIKVHKAIGGNSLVQPFDQFINTLYAKRKASKVSSERLFLKVLMNSLYGKIASKNQVTRSVSRYSMLRNSEQRIKDVKWITYHRGLLDFATPQQPYVNVLWGAMITAYARNLLYEHMADVPPDKLIYCDTDSVYTFEHEMPVSNELGEMKLEKSVEVMKVIQPKAYQLDGEYRAKGVPKPRWSEEKGMIIDYAKQYIEEGYTQFEAPIRFRASLNSHRGRANQWVPHHKTARSGYTSKTLSGDCFLPPVIGEQLELSLPKRQAVS